MSFSRPIQWYHSHADQIWPDSTFKANVENCIRIFYYFPDSFTIPISLVKEGMVSNFITQTFHYHRCQLYKTLSVKGQLAES